MKNLLKTIFSLLFIITVLFFITVVLSSENKSFFVDTTNDNNTPETTVDTKTLTNTKDSGDLLSLFTDHYSKIKKTLPHRYINNFGDRL